MSSLDQRYPTTPQLHYTDKGKGPTLVLIHGFCESMKIWDGLEDSLSEDHRIIRVDLPGFGQSPLEHDSPSLDHYAEEVHAVLTYLGVETCIMLGHSMGGYITLAYAEKHPEQLKGIVFFHATAYPDSEEQKSKRDKTVEFLRRNGTQAFVNVLIPSFFTPANKEAHKPQISNLLEDVVRTPPEHLIKALLAMKNRPDRTHVLKEASFPVLFIVGKQDKVVPWESGLEQFSLPDRGVVYFLDGVAHMGMFEAPQKTLYAIRSFTGYCHKAS